MAYWAVLDGTTVVNMIIADSQEIAQEATGLPCVEYTVDNPASVGFTWNGKKFIAPVVIDEPLP